MVPQDEWRMPRGDAAQSGYLPAAVCMPPVGGGAVGARRRSLRMAVDATMIAAYDYLFLPTQAHGLRVINVDTLEDVTTLESPFGNPLHLAPAVAGGAVYVASPFGLACYDLTRTLGAGGNLRPTLVGEPVRAKEHILTSPLVVGEHVVFGTEGGVQRLTPGGTQAAPQPLAFGKASLLARHGDCLVFSPDGESLAAVDLAGALRWQRRPRRWQQPDVRINAWAGLMSLGDRLVFADDDGRLWVLYPEGDQSVVVGHWPEGIVGMAATPDGGYVVGSHEGLFALDMSGGKSWALDQEAVACPPVVTKHLVLAGTTGGSLLIVDRRTGALDKYPVGSGAVRGIAVSGASVLAVTGEGDLAAYDLPLDGEG